MALKIFAMLFLSCLATVQASEPLSSPAFLIMGTSNGEIQKCSYDNLENCEVFYKGNKSVDDVLVHGEYLFTSLDNRVMRCMWYEKNSCTEFHRTESGVTGLVVLSGYLYAGLEDGTLLRCHLSIKHSCLKAYLFPGRVNSIFRFNNYIHVASDGNIYYCTHGENVACFQVSQYSVQYEYVDLVMHFSNIYIVVRASGDGVSLYTLTSNNTLIFKNTVPSRAFNFDEVMFRRYHANVEVFKRKIYASLDPYGIIYMYEEKKHTFVKFFQNRAIGYAFKFAYSVHHKQHPSGIEDNCIEQSSPRGVFKYEVERRAMLEVSVVDGVLCDARGAAVDTRRADRGHSGRAAVFAMGPDGQLLLSHAHRSGLVHISSLFAGHPVAGAGEIVVHDGVVKRIIACSLYYLPDVELNKQVVDELYQQGYDRADEISLEPCYYTCDPETNDEL